MLLFMIIILTCKHKSVTGPFSNIMLTQAYGEERLDVRDKGGNYMPVLWYILVYIQYIPVSLVSLCSLQLLSSAIALKIVSNRK